jgi:hypothetical protein
MDKMIDLSRESVDLVLKGKTWKISPPTVGDLVAFEAYVRNKNLKAYMENASLTKEDSIMKAKMISALMNESVPGELTTLDGVVFLLWRCLQRNHQELTLEIVGNMINLDEIPYVSELLASLMMGKSKEEDKKEEDKSDSENPTKQNP